MCSPSDGGGFLIVALLCEKRKGIPGILISPAVVCLVVVTSSLAIVCVAVSDCSTVFIGAQDTFAVCSFSNQKLVVFVLNKSEIMPSHAPRFSTLSLFLLNLSSSDQFVFPTAFAKLANCMSFPIERAIMPSLVG